MPPSPPVKLSSNIPTKDIQTTNLHNYHHYNQIHQPYLTSSDSSTSTSNGLTNSNQPIGLNSWQQPQPQHSSASHIHVSRSSHQFNHQVNGFNPNNFAQQHQQQQQSSELFNHNHSQQIERRTNGLSAAPSIENFDSMSLNNFGSESSSPSPDLFNQHQQQQQHYFRTNSLPRYLKIQN
jgi:hypothetical protein